MSNYQSVVVSATPCLRNNYEHEDSEKRFWQQWQQYRDYLYRCCLKWMGGNLTDADDALSRAMLKAWEKVQKYAGEIANFKAWLTRLTHNLCVDIHRERDRSANRVENIEVYASVEEQGLITLDDTPEIAMETHEKTIVIRRAIDNLPTRLRETFILHFYQELSYPEIAQQQDISYQNVCKRISQARAILREELRGYFIAEDATDTDLLVTPILAATESAIGEMSQGNAGVEPIVGEMVTLSVAVEEVESVVGEESIEVALSMQLGDSAPVAAPCDIMSVQITVITTVRAASPLGEGKQSQKPCDCVVSLRSTCNDILRVIYRTSYDGKLEVNRDGCRCVEAVLCERQPALILALTQFDEETGSWGNSCLTVLLMQQQSEAGKGWVEFLLPSRSPPWYRLSYWDF
ncbi:RNA polymerase sigma factor [Nostoc favosum]|uniref:Sigma-70 family RNA polymerase sigma factor n=1 Tax=Nostoc favosum CHAB5714 TaxID=2780399 RepID=A0ABS8IHF7_9NOSO|nr:sigma-70 family RNA polymerase sigma factor [Nostoc favosum]MCC5603627.1 sigma-70 family RNA polymerase sigma factor [Nostoc favosum CHAB5714]